MRRFVTLFLPFIPFVGMIVLIGSFVFGIHTYDKITRPTLHLQIDPQIAHINAIKELVLKNHLYAEAFYQWELWKEAQERENRKIEQGTNSAALFLAQAFAQENQQYYAIEIFETLVEDSPFTSNQGMYAQWLLKWGKFERALEMMEEIRLIDANFKVTDYFLYAKTLEQAGRRQAAIDMAIDGLEKQKMYALYTEYHSLKAYLQQLKGTATQITKR